MQCSKLDIMRDEDEEAVRPCSFQCAPQASHQRRMEMDLGLVDNQSLIFRHAKHLSGEIENGTLAIAHLSAWIQLLLVSLPKHGEKLCVLFNEISMRKYSMPNSIKPIKSCLWRMRLLSFLLLCFATVFEKTLPLVILLCQKSRKNRIIVVN